LGTLPLCSFMRSMMLVLPLLSRPTMRMFTWWDGMMKRGVRRSRVESG
jgi:hypothetical protein